MQGRRGCGAGSLARAGSPQRRATTSPQSPVLPPMNGPSARKPSVSFEKRGPAAFEELANKDPARYLILMAQLIPQHFKHEVEHTIAGFSPEEVRMRLAESRAKLLEAGVDLDLLPVPPVGRG